MSKTEELIIAVFDGTQIYNESKNLGRLLLNDQPVKELKHGKIGCLGEIGCTEWQGAIVHLIIVPKGLLSIHKHGTRFLIPSRILARCERQKWLPSFTVDSTCVLMPARTALAIFTDIADIMDAAPQ